MSTDAKEYEQRKRFISDLKQLAKPEKEQIFRIIKTANIPYSENSNGIFFDLLSIDTETFQKLVTYISFSKDRAKEQEARLQEMNTLRHDLVGEEEVV